MNSSLTSHHHTIFALATGMGRAAIAIIRGSGDLSASLLTSLIKGELPPARKASLRTLYGDHDDILDHALILWFPSPNSYTGEDSFELHLHAGPAIIEAVSERLVSLGARPAEPGEFTRRSVQKGRLDLLQAEAISDLIEAETHAQRQQALLQADGALSKLYQNWGHRLRSLLAQQEALIDFPDEDLPPEVDEALSQTLTSLQKEITDHLHDDRGEITRNGLNIVIAGAPNVGKSSLLNALCGYDAAIVTQQAGTTRDAISVDWVFKGIKLRLIDTAGLRETHDLIEAEGIKRAKKHIDHADLVLHLIAPHEEISSLKENEILIRTKTDITPAKEGELGIHTKHHDGLLPLRAFLESHLKKIMQNRANPPLTRARHRAGLEEARHHLVKAQTCPWPELRGEELRLAMQALGRLTGHVDIESLLDTIFSQFCIGK